MKRERILGLQAEEYVNRFQRSTLATSLGLVVALGRAMVGLLTGVSSTRIIGIWIDKGVDPKPRREAILRYALGATDSSLTRVEACAVQRWFVRPHALLRDAAPPEALR